MKELPIKNEFASGLLELSRLASTERVTGSRMVSAKPVWLLSALVTPDNPNEFSNCQLINGETSTQEILLHLKGTFAHPTHCSPIPMYFNRGLYLTLQDNVQAITIQYLVDSP